MSDIPCLECQGMPGNSLFIAETTLFKSTQSEQEGRFHAPGTILEYSSTVYSTLVNLPALLTSPHQSTHHIQRRTVCRNLVYNGTQYYCITLPNVLSNKNKPKKRGSTAKLNYANHPTPFHPNQAPPPLS